MESSPISASLPHTSYPLVPFIPWDGTGRDGTGFFKISQDCTNTAAGSAPGGGWGGRREKNKE